MDENTGRDDIVRFQLSQLGKSMHLRDGELRRSRHDGIEVTPAAAVAEITPAITAPGFDQSHIRPQTVLEQVVLAVEGPHLFAGGHGRANAGRGVESGNAGTAGPDAFRKGSL